MSRSMYISNTSRRGCQGYIKRLHNQIQVIGEEVDSFNLRERREGNKGELKKLSSPKYQKIVLERDLNPEYKKIQPNSKISSLFKNCSALTKYDFGFCNPSTLVNSVLMQKVDMKAVERQKKLASRLKTLQKNWMQVQSYREANQIKKTQYACFRDKKTQKILTNVQKRRPLSCIGSRADSTLMSFTPV